MDLGSILLIMGLAVLVSIFVSRPLLDRQTEETPLVVRKAIIESEHEKSVLLAEQERLLTALQELDFDHALGKIPPEDYPLQRAVLLQAGVDVLSRLDSLKDNGSGSHISNQEAEEQLEMAIASRRADAEAAAVVVGGAATRSVNSTGDELETLIASRRRARQERSAGFCPKCGKPLQKSDQFCARCGARIQSG